MRLKGMVDQSLMGSCMFERGLVLPQMVLKREEATLQHRQHLIVISYWRKQMTSLEIITWAMQSKMLNREH